MAVSRRRALVGAVASLGAFSRIPPRPLRGSYQAGVDVAVDEPSRIDPADRRPPCRASGSVRSPSAAGAPASAPSSERSTTSADPSPPSQSDSLMASSSPRARHGPGLRTFLLLLLLLLPISSPISCSPVQLPLPRSPLPSPSPSPASDGPPRTAAWSVRVRVRPRPLATSRLTGSSWSTVLRLRRRRRQLCRRRRRVRLRAPTGRAPGGRGRRVVRLRSSRPLAPRLSLRSTRRRPALLRARLAFSGAARTRRAVAPFPTLAHARSSPSRPCTLRPPSPGRGSGAGRTRLRRCGRLGTPS